MRILVDKLTSVTKNVPLSHRLKVTADFKPRDGVLLVVEVLDNKKIYNKIELVNGRFSMVKKGDVLVVALGERRALRGFVGAVPKQLATGGIIHLLNLGGVAGECTSASTQHVGMPMRLKVLGAVADESGKAMSIKQFTLFKPQKNLTSTVPLIIVSGTCMNVGKTSVASEIIKHASHSGYNVAAAKLAGIAALKDTEIMQDYGAVAVASFLDAGYTSTIGLNGDGSKLTYGALNYLSKSKPDAIIVEFGDGILGEYGVLTLLKDPSLRKRVKAHIGCAHDPVGALKLYELCKEMKMPLTLISGPVTDNSVGVGFIENNIHLQGVNALYNGKALYQAIEPLCFKKK